MLSLEKIWPKVEFKIDVFSIEIEFSLCFFNAYRSQGILFFFGSLLIFVWFFFVHKILCLIVESKNSQGFKNFFNHIKLFLPLESSKLFSHCRISEHFAVFIVCIFDIKLDQVGIFNFSIQSFFPFKQFRISFLFCLWDDFVAIDLDAKVRFLIYEVFLLSWLRT